MIVVYLKFAQGAPSGLFKLNVLEPKNRYINLCQKDLKYSVLIVRNTITTMKTVLFVCFVLVAAFATHVVAQGGKLTHIFFINLFNLIIFQLIFSCGPAMRNIGHQTTPFELQPSMRSFGIAIGYLFNWFKMLSR